MNNARKPSRIAAAIRYLNDLRQFLKFDNQERIVKVGIDSPADGDEIAAHVGQLVDLQSLTFYESDLTDVGLRELSHLVNLRDLTLRGSKITADGLRCLEAMSRLKDLSIETAQDLDLRAFERIGRVQSLLELSLKGGRFRDADLAPLAGLTNLQELRLYEAENVTGGFASHLVGLTQLRTFIAWNTKHRRWLGVHREAVRPAESLYGRALYECRTEAPRPVKESDNALPSFRACYGRGRGPCRRVAAIRFSLPGYATAGRRYHSGSAPLLNA